MNQEKRRIFLIQELLKKNSLYLDIPRWEYNQKELLKSLLFTCQNTRVSWYFLWIQNMYLKKEQKGKKEIDLSMLKGNGCDLFIFKGDIALLKCDSIVCGYNPDIISKAGIQLRYQFEKNKINTGQVKICSGYNLKSRYCMRTKGPEVKKEVKQKHKDELTMCYKNALKLADRKSLKSIAFYMTSESEIPNDIACAIACRTVKEYKESTKSPIKVIFCIERDMEEILYTAYMNG